MIDWQYQEHVYDVCLRWVTYQLKKSRIQNIERVKTTKSQFEILAEKAGNEKRNELNELQQEPLK